MKYGLIGEHLSHSKSPMIHSFLKNNEYTLKELSPDELGTFMEKKDFLGVNVTIPYKKAVIPYLDELSPAAKRAGSVNTVIKRDDGTLFGDNTDVFGFSELLHRSDIRIAGKKVLILGSGGASGAVMTAILDKAPASVTVISRTGEDNYENISRHADADILINTTPVGMYPDVDSMPVDLDVFTRLSAVIDIVYNPFRTKLILAAQQRKIKTVGGMTMLVAQAVASDALFFCKDMNTESFRLITSIEKKLISRTRNIVFIGMPGSGKSVTALRLATAMHRPFYDIDREIEAGEGRSPADIIREDGEEAFRKIETEYTRRVCSASGAVIATGGGVVTKEENRDILRRNSFVIYLIRETSKLSVKNRPLSDQASLEELAKARIPLYSSWSDMKILNTGIGPTVSNLLFNLRNRHK